MTILPPNRSLPGQARRAHGGLYCLRHTLNLLGIVAITVSFAVTSPARAARSDDLTSISRVFGELHHVRRLCEPRREAELWRERMKQMVRLEQPTARLRQSLVAAFNEGFRSSQERVQTCDEFAETYSVNLATEASAIIDRLSQ
ncbi:MAG: TIGR02301 family protein [Pseudomonadota bacterium]